MNRWSAHILDDVVIILLCAGHQFIDWSHNELGSKLLFNSLYDLLVRQFWAQLSNYLTNVVKFNLSKLRLREDKYVVANNMLLSILVCRFY